MPIHQVELARRAPETTDPRRVSALLRGESSLRAALAIDEGTIAAFQRQAAVLFEARRWQACVDVVLGLVELDAAGLDEAVMLAKAYAALGDGARASAVEVLVENVMAQQAGRMGGREGTR